MPTDFSATFVIDSSFRVPGLGVLALPAAPAPGWLLACELHTALALTLLADGHPPAQLTGTVEEVAPADQPPQRALLLDFDPGSQPLAGAQVLASPSVWQE